MLARVIWKNSQGEELEEVVEVLKDEIQLQVGDVPAGITVGDLINDSGLVMFEDDNGVFGLDPNKIVSIDPI